jgi:hypothetical protein
MVESTWKTGVRRPWKMEEIAALHDLAIQRLSVREIARQLNRSPGSVDRRLRHERGIQWREDLPPIPPTRETPPEGMDSRFQNAMVKAGYHRHTVDEPGTERPMFVFRPPTFVPKDT